MARKDGRKRGGTDGRAHERDARSAAARSKRPGAARAAPAGQRMWVVVVCAVLAIATFTVYGQIARHDFIVFDDNEYIYENPHITTGLTPANIQWAFTAYYSNNWHPVTWISHMLDCQLFGLQPGAHHLMGAFLHVLNALLVFLLLRRMTGALWRSAFVAAAFALDPMHVESVAWGSERKDVLSTLFGLGTIWAYVSYAQRPALPRYVVVIGLFALGIMAKPMLVTLPFVLLLLDWWPLGRFSGAPASVLRPPKRTLAQLVTEKLPMLAIVVASSILTLIAQAKGGVVRSLEELSPAMRVANALVSYLRYAFKLLVPYQQAFYYPYPKALPIAAAAGATLLLAVITWYVWRKRRGQPWALVGWLWFAGTLVPVIGLVQVATQSIADRYSYIPSIGLFIVVAWGIDELSRRWPQRGMLLGAASGVLLVSFAAKAHAQTAYWKDSVTLFEHDARIIRDNVLAWRNLGVAYFKLERYDDSVASLQKVLRVHPNDEVSMFDMGTSYERAGKLDLAEHEYREAIAIKPQHVEAHYNLGGVLNRLGKVDEAIAEFQTAIRMKPDFFEAYNNLGNALSKAGRNNEAIAAYQEALRRNPSYLEGHNNFGTVLKSLGRMDEALREYDQALRLNPQFAAAQYNSAIIYLQRGDSAQAMSRFDAAARIDPKLVNPLRPR